MPISKYSTSKEEIFQELYQSYITHPTEKQIILREKAELIKKSWLTQLENKFDSLGLMFKYSLKPSEIKYHTNSNHPYYSITAPLYILELSKKTEY